MKQNRLIDYLDHMQQAAIDAYGIHLYCLELSPSLGSGSMCWSWCNGRVARLKI